jgi:hypothetical protein
MFAEIYVDALLVDPVSADEVWELWDAGLISDDLAAWALLVASGQGAACPLSGLARVWWTLSMSA